MRRFRRYPAFSLLAFIVSVCTVTFFRPEPKNNGNLAAELPRAEPGLGIGFLWTPETEPVAAKLASGKDFVDVILGPGKLDIFTKVSPPVKIACIARSLEKDGERPFPGIKETIGILREAGIGPERVIIAYNPENQPGTPAQELEQLVESTRLARQMAQSYGAPLLVGPGLKEMESREHLYPELAKLCDIWLIQSQRLQLDLATRMPVSLPEYREKVKRIVDSLRQGNSGIQIFVQVVTTAEGGATVLTAEQVAGYALAVKDMIDAVRIYGGSGELLNQIIEKLHPLPLSVPDTAVDSPPAQTLPPVLQSIMIPMRDGKALATDIFIPADFSAEKNPGGIPVIYVCTPYDKSKESPVNTWRDMFLRNGYAFAVQDMRGFHASAGAGQGASRHYDGYDTTEWLAKQPWCNGRIGMLGYSHLGAAQYETAVAGPPHLVCAIPAQAPGNYYTDSYYPATFRKADMETILRGPFTSQIRQLIDRRIRSRESSSIPGFNIPMIHSAGWYDFYKEGAIEMFRACREQGGPGARGTQKLLIGPWGHGVLQEENSGSPLVLPGGMAYPANSKLDWESDFWLPWFDYWLRDEQTGVMDKPSVRYYLMGDADNPEAPGNEWVEADDFPPPSTPVSWFAHSDHTLQTEPPAAESSFIQYRYDPRDPVPTVGRLDARFPVKGPYDQRDAETRQDVILFTTPKLTAPLSIVGQVRVKLWASSDRRDTDFTAKLTDVYPDGRSMIFLDSVVKGRHRNTFLKEEFLTPGQVYEFEIDLGYIAIVLAPGHRLRLAISSSNFDRFDINPNTGEPYGDHAVSRLLLTERLRAEPRQGEPEYTAALVATNTIYLDRGHPTHVVLPVVSGDDLTPVNRSPDASFPAPFSLKQNYPNPFNPATIIPFTLARPGQVTLTIYTIRGRIMRVLHDGYLPAGEHVMEWNGQDDANRPGAAGVYFYQLRVGGHRKTGKMLMLDGGGFAPGETFPSR
ncbi:MAG: CocE/NonD family hydrolase [Candidatus Latescibacterota bacterium]